tara:strand:- start:388 stop:942 length:555 start_codon:yes stop_codon:yes gene_type:complete
MTQDQKTISSIIAVVFIFIILIGSCSHNFKSPYVDPVLKPAFDEWVNQCELRDIKYKRDIANIDSILFAPLEEGYWGQCFGNKIIINENAISPIDLFTLKLVLFHELGHCAFGYDHFEWGEDIMNSVLPEEKIIMYQYFWAILEDQYFIRYLTKKERRKLQKRLEKQDCFCILNEDKLQVKESN